ncbi:lutropin-choriogonadotropic hormone receptor-like [Cimex lectularius]|uniref:G-protein coupled receptors family 1 profile domain-containing protein n=1 Tax=Cimex lectularius TaxID=79782 RepID=A0A8I6RP86_CIMLE|nr:lutropin-choriogonadotropic hormone receptor-like [Cimex lectularius]
MIFALLLVQLVSIGLTMEHMNVTTILVPIVNEEEVLFTDMNGSCKCWGKTTATVSECQCVGESLVEVPKNLTKNIERLTIRESGIKVITNESLTPYKDTLKEFTFMNNQQLESIEAGVFQDLPQIRTIYIVHAPALKKLSDGVLQAYLPNLRALRIVHCGLEILPYMDKLTTYNHVSILDLESNMITRLNSNHIKIRADQLILNYNQIQEIETDAFHGSQISILTLRGNKELTTLHTNSFRGITSLRMLDLSETSILYLPIKGLQHLEILKLQNVRSLTMFPSIYNFQYITKVYLTYAYHCCAFHFPSRHDPERFAKHEDMKLKMKENCSRTTRVKRDWGAPILQTIDTNFTDSSEKEQEMYNGYFTDESFGQDGITVGPKVIALCGNISKDYRKVECYPEPDAFNPCEDLMGNWTLRVAVWLVAIAALVGNTAVLLVLLSSRFRMTVPKFLMCNLALADLCMGVYLLMIAIMDAKSIGDYFNAAIDWQSGLGCQVAGFLTVFSSELSVLTLTVITTERWYTITYAIHMNKRLKLSTAVKIMAAGWVYAIIMAALPLMGVSGYYKTSICLPFESSTAIDLAYLITLLAFNGIAFWVICLCYSRMYCSIRRGREPGGPALVHSDMTVAKRMALLVFTDFACWAPIAFFGLTALAGLPLIDVTKSKILLVFFYPLNSCANPYLYALLTHQYRRDVLIILSRYGICSDKAARYKITATGRGPGGQGQGDDARGQRAGRGSLLTTLTSFDCTRQPSLGPLPEISLGVQNGTSTV